jgi:hypothetical protein
VNARYLTEVVEHYNICPFAEGARSTGALERRVILGDPLTESLRAVEELGAREKIVVGILIYPRHTEGAEKFEQFVAELRAADGARRAGKHGPFAFATFHPDAPFGADTPDRLVMFLRRSPDPCVQLVRFSALEAVRSAAPGGKFLFDFTPDGYAELARRAQAVPVSERIARDNFATVGRVGLARLEEVLADIRADRARSYARLGLK